MIIIIKSPQKCSACLNQITNIVLQPFQKKWALFEINFFKTITKKNALDTKRTLFLYIHFFIKKNHLFKLKLELWKHVYTNVFFKEKSEVKNIYSCVIYKGKWNAPFYHVNFEYWKNRYFYNLKTLKKSVFSTNWHQYFGLTSNRFLLDLYNVISTYLTRGSWWIMSF